MPRLLACFVATMAIAQPISAAAATPFIGTTQHTAFVDSTHITSVRGRSLALCHNYEMRTILGLGAGLSSGGYVLSDTACRAPETMDNPGLINVAFASGALNGTPREAAFTLEQRLEGYSFYGAVGLVAMALAGLFLLRPRRRTSPAPSRAAERMEVLGLREGLEFRAIDAMLHAAHAAGEPSARQIELITERAREIAEMDYTSDHVEWAICQTDTLTDASDFERFGADFAPEEAALVLRSAIEVATANGAMFPTERRFVADLSAALGFEQGQADGILHEVAPRGAAAA